MSHKAASQFRDAYSFEHRRTKAEIFLERNPDRIPCIVELVPGTEDLLLPATPIHDIRYAVPSYYTVLQLLIILRRRMGHEFPSSHSLKLFVGCWAPSGNTMIKDLYERFKDEDLFLYLMYRGEASYGGVAQEEENQ